MSDYLFSGYFNNQNLLSGSATGLFDNRHLQDLLEEGLEPTEVDWGGDSRRCWAWCPEEVATRNPGFGRPVRWRRGRGAPEAITFGGAVFTSREWKKSTVARRRAGARSRKWEEPQQRPSFTFLLRRRAEEKSCSVAKLLLQQLRIERLTHLPRWDGGLEPLRKAIMAAEWQGLPYGHSFQSFWEWWAVHIHPRL